MGRLVYIICLDRSQGLTIKEIHLLDHSVVAFSWEEVCHRSVHEVIHLGFFKLKNLCLKINRYIRVYGIRRRYGIWPSSKHVTVIVARAKLEVYTYTYTYTSTNITFALFFCLRALCIYLMQCTNVCGRTLKKKCAKCLRTRAAPRPRHLHHVPVPCMYVRTVYHY